MKSLYLKFVNKFYQQIDTVQKIVEGNSLEEGFLPTITISRDPGSGGKPIATLVAKKLDFEFYDDKLLEEVAKSAKLRKEVLARVDERQRTAIQDLVHHLMNPDYVSETRYIKHLCKVVLTLAKKGGVVLLGRGGNFIVPKKYTLRVRITAPYRTCVSRAVKYEGVDYQKAREIIREVSAERAGYVKQYFGKDVGSSKYYDLVINTAYMSIDDAADIIVAAYRRRFPRKGILYSN